MRYLITTSIPYVNDDPHIGHLYEFVLADIFARYYRNLNKEVFFLSGTDENGIKIAKSAVEAGKNIKDFVDEKYNKFFELKDKFFLSFDHFIRTSSEEHKKAVYKFWQLCQEDIYLNNYSGYYCYSCEAYYDEKDIKDLICPLHKKKLEKIEEKNYFFKLTKYLDEIKNLIEQERIKIYPQEKKLEILNILKVGEIRDLSISRDSKRSYGWGIPVPRDSQQVIYVWFDALINYLSGLGFGSEDETIFKKFWNEGEIIHFIGKDIVKFHAIYWPAMLLSAKIKIPEKIVVHYFINIKGEKMSKTIGNVISPNDLLEKFQAEEIRAYLAHQTIFNDWDFNFQNLRDFKEGILKKEIGNLILRIFGLLKKAPLKINLNNNLLKENSSKINRDFNFYINNNFEINLAYLIAFDLVKEINNFIDQKKIWNNLTDENLSTIIINLFEILNYYRPLMPQKIEEIIKKIEIDNNFYLNKEIDLSPLF